MSFSETTSTQPDRLDERVARGLDPVVHRVEAGDDGAGALLADASLQVGLDVREEGHPRLPRARREHRIESGEDVQLRVEGVRDLHVRVVAPRPEERLLTGDSLDVVDVDAARLEDRELLGPEVVADHADHPNVGEEACGEGEVRRSPAEDAIALAERGLECVERDRADHGDGHSQTLVAAVRMCAAVVGSTPTSFAYAM